jgi:uracil phosphoribosyltransferase
MSNLIIIEHPLIQSKLSLLRNKETGNKEFREITKEIATLICYEATKDIPVVDIEVETPNGKTNGKALAEKVAVVPILREGLGMLDGILSLIPTAKVGHIGLYRDPETLLSIEYYCKLPSDLDKSQVLLIDPMVATGGNACSAIQFMKERGAKNIKLLCIMTAPEGVKRIQNEHPDTDIYTTALDTHLDENGYVFPGLGDAGDRLFGTK